MSTFKNYFGYLKPLELIQHKYETKNVTDFYKNVRILSVSHQKFNSQQNLNLSRYDKCRCIESRIVEYSKM